ncbi:MAG: ATP-binding protein, partial [Chloroflexota bacterium]
MDISNPYCPVPQVTEACAFVGREKLFDLINQYFLDSTSPHAFLVTGKPLIGKTQALRQLNQRFSERYIGVYISLRNVTLSSDAQILKLFTRSIMESFAESHLQIIDSRDDNTEDDSGKITPAWFAEVFIPRVLYSIRAHRQLIFLVDDAEPLITYWQAHRSVAGITALLQDHDQLHMVLTTSDVLEPEVPELDDLVSTQYMHRLENLSDADVIRFANLSPAYVLDEPSAHLIARLTGGMPVVLQWLCYLLHEQTYSAEHLPHTFTVNDIRVLVPDVLQQTSSIFYEEWQQLTLNERLVLTALSMLFYRDPLQPVTVHKIEDWLIATDYPLDETAIKSSIRGLEYRLLVRSEGGGLVAVGSILQTWLVTHAQLDDTATASTPGASSRRIQLLVGVGVVLLVVAA